VSLPTRNFICATILLAFIGVSLSAQQTTSLPVTLNVVDVKGAAIPHAQVKLDSAPLNLREILETDNSGSLTVNLALGKYDVSVMSPGFSIFRRQIDVQEARTQIFLHIVLSVASNSCPEPCVTASRVPSIIPEQPANSTMLHPVNTLLVSASPNSSKTFDAAALKSLPHVTVTIHNPHTNTDETYSGVPLIDLLSSLGAPHGKDLRGKALSEYIVAIGSDGYKAVLALAEIDPEFHPGQILIADAMDGKPLDAKTGPFRLVVTEDKRPARSVHSLISIEVKSAE
jgi:hypothetical protein